MFVRRVLVWVFGFPGITVGSLPYDIKCFEAAIVVIPVNNSLYSLSIPVVQLNVEL